MTQETTGEFAYRLQQAIESCEHAPPTPHGRQRWLLRKLALETGLEVSPNTMHKWVNGSSRPREDNIRKLAKVLSVDEVWLALGRKPVDSGSEAANSAVSTSASVYLAAGFIMSQGGQVVILDHDKEGANVRVNLGGTSFRATVVAPSHEDSSGIKFIVPEPSKGRVLGIVQIADCDHTCCAEVLDLTDVERTNFGGFSIIQIEKRPKGKYKAPNQRNLISPLGDVDELATA